ncbi:hypothetical protein LIA77_00013 [Sarocladium implicatum]|nr:hypothetical protein LIA77_00013 [Sarocladium implicatum]
MACRMGRSGYQVTGAMSHQGPRDRPLSHGIKEASRVGSRDKDHDGAKGDPERSQEGITNEQEVIPRGVHRDSKYIRDSYYYQR